MTTDPCLPLMQQCLDHAEHPALLIADENFDPAGVDWCCDSPALQLLTNRWDIGHALHLHGKDVQCSDFDFGAYRDQQFRTVIYRVSKERAVTHHIINQCGRVIATGGKLLLIGHKREGLLSYQRRAADYLNGDAGAHRAAAGYRIFELSRNRTLGKVLDDEAYVTLRPCVDAGTMQLYSKPGIYGWSKIDRGSCLLMDAFDRLHAKNSGADWTSILDLGCGYGYLSARAARTSSATIWATDNNCAAVAACKKNFTEFNINGKVIADDCARHIDCRFDVILCNPPFHRGFETSRTMTDHFLQQAAKHLEPDGFSLFVVNQFIGLEKAAARHFRKTEEIARLDGFKLMRMTH